MDGYLNVKKGVFFSPYGHNFMLVGYNGISLLNNKTAIPQRELSEILLGM